MEDVYGNVYEEVDDKGGNVSYVKTKKAKQGSSCPNCGEQHGNKDSWYCHKCETRLSKWGLETNKEKLDSKYVK